LNSGHRQKQQASQSQGQTLNQKHKKHLEKSALSVTIGTKPSAEQGFHLG
jgi:hypothetical protein